MKLFHNRRHAGQLLAEKLQDYSFQPDVCVLALADGGVAIGYEVAKYLHVPLDVFQVRPVRLPYFPELTIGTVASGGVCIRDEGLISYLRIEPEKVEWLFREQEEKLAEKEQSLRPGAPMLDVDGRTVILVSDGIAADSTIRLAIKALRKLRPERLVVAVPVAPSFAWIDLHLEADRFVTLFAPDPMGNVADWYDEFEPVSPGEEAELLMAAPFENELVTA